MGSAAVQETLWRAGVSDWAELCEPWTEALYTVTFSALAPLTGSALLDAGCGSGLALMLAAEQGAQVTGLDATRAMLDVARKRLPQADLKVGDIQELPFHDATFDVVTAFNAVQYAVTPAAAVAELARVTRPGGRVAIGVWGDPSRCETSVIFDEIRRRIPPPPDGAAPLAISTPGVVEELLTGAGLGDIAGGEVSCPFTYPDRETGWRGQSSIGPLRTAINTGGEDAVREAFFDALRQFRQPDGTYRQENVFRYVIARKPAR